MAGEVTERQTGIYRLSSRRYDPIPQRNVLSMEGCHFRRLCHEGKNCLDVWCCPDCCGPVMVFGPGRGKHWIWIWFPRLPSSSLLLVSIPGLRSSHTGLLSAARLLLSSPGLCTTGSGVHSTPGGTAVLLSGSACVSDSGNTTAARPTDICTSSQLACPNELSKSSCSALSRQLLTARDTETSPSVKSLLLSTAFFTVAISRAAPSAAPIHRGNREKARERKLGQAHAACADGLLWAMLRSP
jgi:hypothetical protein